jgi:hypothetical protein
MRAEKSTANPSKPSTSAKRRTTRARLAKIAQTEAPARKRTAKRPQHGEGILETVVESVKEAPGRIGHVAEVAGAAAVERVKEVPGQVSKVVEKVAEVAGAAVEKTGALAGEIADKVGIGDSKEASSDAKGKRK